MTMKKIGIFYGSSTGMTAEVAEEIAKAMGVDTSDIHNLSLIHISEPTRPY